MVIDAIVDTGVLIDYLRKDEAARQWFKRVSDLNLGITPVVWMETVQGATDKQKRDQIISFLHQFRLEHPTKDDNLWAMRQVARFSLGYGIRFPDAMIASVTVRLGVPLYTLNIKHYAPLPGVDARRPY